MPKISAFFLKHLAEARPGHTKISVWWRYHMGTLSTLQVFCEKKYLTSAFLSQINPKKGNLKAPHY